MSTQDNSSFYPTIAVAAVDLLGIKSLLKKEDDAKSAISAIIQLRANSLNSTYYDDPEGRKLAGFLYHTEEYFSDSVYFFPDPTLDIGNQIDLLTAKCASLVVVGLKLFPRGFLLRGGIAVGNLRTKTIDTPKGKQEVRIGTAMAKAHLIQEAQEWIGAAIEGEFVGKPDNINRIKYDIPLNSNKKESICVTQAVNWVYIMVLAGYTKDDILGRIHESVDSVGNHDSQQGTKLKNTIEFVEYVFSHPEHLATE